MLINLEWSDFEEGTDTTKQVKIAIVGLGVQGPVHAEWSRNLCEAELVAVCDVVDARAKELAAKYHCDWYNDYDKMLERKDIDAVIVATPANTHASLAIAAAKAGKHVAVEKPVSITLQQADDMIKAVKKAGVLDCYFENLCYAPVYAMAKKIVDDGGLGTPFFMRCGESDGKGIDKYREKFETPKHLDSVAEKIKKTEKKSTEAGYGYLQEGGCHPIMFCRYMYDRQPVSKVYAETRAFLAPGHDDVATLTITYKAGQIAWVDACRYALGTFDDRVEIYGTKGTIFADLYGSNMTTGVKVYSESGFNPAIGSSRYPNGLGFFGVQTNWSHPIADEEYSLGYFHEQQAFLRSLLAGQRPNVNFDDGKATLEVILGAYKSRDTGTAVTLPLDI
jgi:predicted dehydrogenase